MRKPLKLLLVEDDAEDALIFKAHLPSGFHFDRASDCYEARRLMQQTRHDVLFVDYYLGAESGLGFIRALRESGSSVAIVLLSGLDIEALGENALLAGATDFLAKDELNAVNIERIARWALVRQHVQTLQERMAK